MLSIAPLILGGVLPPPAHAETCPDDEPTAISGRIVVDEPNLDPPGLRGVGDVFVYAYERGASTPDSRFMAVTDPEGHFCIHDTTAGDWVVTTYEPFHFRPLVRELTCAAGACDLGDLAVDGTMVRISDDFIDFGEDWWGGEVAQTLVMPAGAESLAKVTLRSGAASDNDVVVHAGEGVLGAVLGTAPVSFPGPFGGRGSAVFEPGAVTVADGDLITVKLTGGSAPWRDGSDPYVSGQMLTVDGTSTTPVPGTDLCLALDVDGADGQLTSHLVADQNGWVYGGVVSQTFVARSSSITHASLVVGSPCDFCTIEASISASVDGPPIGPVKQTVGLEQQGVAFAWFADEVPVVPGDTYVVRYTFPSGFGVAYARDGALQGRVLGPAPLPELPEDTGDTGITAETTTTTTSTSTTTTTGETPGGDTDAVGGNDASVPSAPGCGCDAAPASVWQPWTRWLARRR